MSALVTNLIQRLIAIARDNDALFACAVIVLILARGNARNAGRLPYGEPVGTSWLTEQGLLL